MSEKLSKKAKYKKRLFLQLVAVIVIITTASFIAYKIDLLSQKRQLNEINSDVSKSISNMLSVNINLLEAFAYTTEDYADPENFYNRANYFVNSFEHILFFQHKDSETITDLNYPRDPYDITLGRSLKNRPEVEEYYKSAIRLKDIVINEPFIFDVFENKPLGLIVRMPLYDKDEFDGFYVLATDLGKEFNLLFRELSNDYDINVFDTNDNLIFGEVHSKNILSERDSISVNNISWSSDVAYSNPVALSLNGIFIIAITIMASLIYLFAYYKLVILRRKNEELTTRMKLVLIQEDLRITLNSIGDGVISTDLDGLIININPAAEDLLDLSLKEIKGKLSSEVIKLYLDEGMSHFDPVSDYLNSGIQQANNQDFIIRNKKEEIHFVNYTITPIIDNDRKQRGMVLVIGDVSDRHIKAEEILRLEKEKNNIEAGLRDRQRISSLGKMAKGLAHEINNPINGIINYCQLIIDEDETLESNSSNANEIIGLAYRVSDLTKNLMDFSGKTRMTPHNTSIKTILKSSLSLIETVMKHDNIEIQNNIENDLPFIKCRPHEIQQVLTHILVNSWDALNMKYPERDQNKVIQIDIRAIKDDKQKSIRISIKDFGTGIADTIKKHIFEPFFTTKTRDKSAGLGLSVSYGIIEDHNGRIRCESIEGEYTEIIVELPSD